MFALIAWGCGRGQILVLRTSAAVIRRGVVRRNVKGVSASVAGLAGPGGVGLYV